MKRLLRYFPAALAMLGVALAGPVQAKPVTWFLNGVRGEKSFDIAGSFPNPTPYSGWFTYDAEDGSNHKGSLDAWDIQGGGAEWSSSGSQSFPFAVSPVLGSPTVLSSGVLVANPFNPFEGGHIIGLVLYASTEDLLHLKKGPIPDFYALDILFKLLEPLTDAGGVVPMPKMFGGSEVQLSIQVGGSASGFPDDLTGSLTSGLLFHQFFSIFPLTQVFLEHRAVNAPPGFQVANIEGVQAWIGPAVPEPEPIALAVLGLTGLIATQRRAQKRNT